MNIEGQNNSQPYKLGNGSGNRNNVLNYAKKDYNNYQSWSNVGRSNIKISSVDENGNVLTNSFKTSRLQPLSIPSSTFTDIQLSWKQGDSLHDKPLQNKAKQN